ncbi:multiple epidermal growth factor-like domains protein 10 [Aplysia californica]|uniref:Multiple epidermal growth factor-like domains protein 10 n=1 Tax=Aplysia californica TaxID=6500 RepID=A0ABM1VTZ5_APLCA|nr:multiple epidermal growth factor-like domains protein 10 [Aplysia californica]
MEVKHGGKCPPGRFGRNCRLTCQCQDNTDCDDVTGSCPRGCREGWSGPSCQRENVVLGMPTDMKTSDWSKGARAVDGDLGTCVTSSSNRTGWWRVDMLASRPVFFMEIFFANQTARPGRIRVHVSDYVDTFWGKPCTRIPASHKRSKYSCDLPSEGRYFGLINKLGQITLCEVFVFVCTPYTFGVDCSQECSCTDPTELCNAITGTCVSGCMDGWSGSSCTKPCNGRYGRKCRHACGHCYGNQLCDHVTGICASGCAPGWTGVRCKQECGHGTYGVDCRHRCHHCLDNVTCLPQTGVCPWRCEPGWTGDRCDTECSPGRYGQSCEFPCGQCYEGSVCDRREGICPIGCEPGYEGLFCTKVCSSGLWGPNCRYSCGQCANYSCDRVTGHCDVMGCQHGWMGSRCDAKCPAGLYGRNCAHMCGHCLGQCDVILGRCPSDCKPGWQGSQCLDKCANDTFGPHCTTACG